MRASFFALLAVAASVSPSSAGPAVFRGVGDLSGGTIWSAALGVSPDGTVVVGSSASNKSSSQAYRWQNGAMVGLAVPGGSGWLMRAHAASDGGRVIVGRLIASESDFGEAVVWDDGHLTHLGFLGGAPSFDSEALAVSADGTRIAGFSTNGTDGIEAFIGTWPNGPMVGLGNGPGESFSSALGISTDGSVLAGATSDDGGFVRAARFQVGGAVTVLEDLPGGDPSSYALALSTDGSTIVGHGRSDAGTEAVRWTSDGHAHTLGAAEAGQPYSFAEGVSRDGATIVGAASGTGSGVAFYWDATHGFRLLADVLTNDYGIDITGWNLVEAHGISADGQVIVGDGINPDGDVEGWIAILDNSPRLGVGRTHLSWVQPYGPSGTKWDVVQGNLSSLRATGGNFQAATSDCLANNTSNTTLNFGPAPAPGDGFWFLARENGGSYDLTYGHQIGSRDSEIAASGLACP